MITLNLICLWFGKSSVVTKNKINNLKNSYSSLNKGLFNNKEISSFWVVFCEGKINAVTKMKSILLKIQFLSKLKLHWDFFFLLGLHCYGSVNVKREIFKNSNSWLEKWLFQNYWDSLCLGLYFLKFNQHFWEL